MMTGIPFSSDDENEPDAFLIKAKGLVGYVSQVPIEQIYIVWFAKTLQNWKALLSTSLADGRYYEVTYNGDEGEAYVDTYQKLVNDVIKDQP